MQSDTPGQTRSRHRLLPHERWLADYSDRKGLAPQGSDRWRLQQNYGPDGMALLLAASSDIVLGAFITMSGVALLSFSVGDPAVGYLVGVGLFVLLVGIARCTQCARVGRIYRDGRPFLRGRSPRG